MYRRVIVEPVELRRAASWLKSKYQDVEGLTTMLEHIVCALRREPQLLGDPATLDVLQCIASVASCGRTNTAELVRAGIPSLLTRFVSLASSVPGLDPDAQELALNHASVALSNCGGETARHLCDVQLRVVQCQNNAVDDEHTTARPDVDGAPHGAADEDAANTVFAVRIGFADYAAGETGARFWAGGVVLSMWLLEQQALVRWLEGPNAAESNAHETTMHMDPMECVRSTCSAAPPLRVVEIGCGPALVSAVLLESTKAWSTPHRPIEIVATDISLHVVEEAAKTLGIRNGNRSECVMGGVAGAVGGVQWRCTRLDFACIPREFVGTCDVVLASDIVYDAHIAALVPPALVSMLRPGTGKAILCCESHRDAMVDFVPKTLSAYGDALELECYAPCVALTQHKLPDGVNPNCSLMIFQRKA